MIVAKGDTIQMFDLDWEIPLRGRGNATGLEYLYTPWFNRYMLAGDPGLITPPKRDFQWDMRILRAELFRAKFGNVQDHFSAKNRGELDAMVREEWAYRAMFSMITHGNAQSALTYHCWANWRDVKAFMLDDQKTDYSTLVEEITLNNRLTADRWGHRVWI